MATYFSNALGADGTGDTTLEAGKRHLPGQFGKSKRVAAFVTQDTANNDVLRMFTLPSSARIVRLWFACTDTGTTGTANVGLYLAGTAHDGAAVDADLFASLIDTATAAVALTEVFSESTTLGLADRGKALWELANIGDATLTADPGVDYDFCIVTATGGDASATYYLEAEYV
jgi:hypothetical protein